MKKILVVLLGLIYVGSGDGLSLAAVQAVGTDGRLESGKMQVAVLDGVNIAFTAQPTEYDATNFRLTAFARGFKDYNTMSQLVTCQGIKDQVPGFMLAVGPVGLYYSKFGGAKSSGDFTRFNLNTINGWDTSTQLLSASCQLLKSDGSYSYRIVIIGNSTENGGKIYVFKTTDIHPNTTVVASPILTNIPVTINGGSIQPSLNSVYAAPMDELHGGEMIVVGDHDTILYSINGGSVWNLTHTNQQPVPNLTQVQGFQSKNNGSKFIISGLVGENPDNLQAKYYYNPNGGNLINWRAGNINLGSYEVALVPFVACSTHSDQCLFGSNAPSGETNHVIFNVLGSENNLGQTVPMAVAAVPLGYLLYSLSYDSFADVYYGLQTSPLATQGNILRFKYSNGSLSVSTMVTFQRSNP